jgi:hypothetical protein
MFIRSFGGAKKVLQKECKYAKAWIPTIQRTMNSMGYTEAQKQTLRKMIKELKKKRCSPVKSRSPKKTSKRSKRRSPKKSSKRSKRRSPKKSSRSKRTRKTTRSGYARYGSQRATKRNLKKGRGSKRSSERSKRTARGCSRQSTKKYSSRSSPPFPANNCCGATKKGNDGQMYKSISSKNGICRWVKV